MSDAPTLEGLTGYQELILSVLVAHARLGDDHWYFDRRTDVTRALRVLSDRRLVDFESSSDPGLWRVSLTLAGQRAPDLFSPTLPPPPPPAGIMRHRSAEMTVRLTEHTPPVAVTAETPGDDLAAVTVRSDRGELRRIAVTLVESTTGTPQAIGEAILSALAGLPGVTR
jgi:hypothetical protein